jgi:hypothetical protein
VTEAFKPDPSMVIFVGCQMTVGGKTYSSHKSILPEDIQGRGMNGFTELMDKQLRVAIAEVSERAGRGACD